MSTVSEVESSDAGAGAVLARLSELVFLETLRRYLRELPPGQTGWLAGARDPLVGQTLALLHQHPGQPWTIAELARRVGTSRTVLADRFRFYLGEPPIAYLTRWRLNLAAEMLASTQLGIGEIAGKAGYTAEAAFNRAFKRAFGCPPAQFRQGKAIE